MVKLVKLIPRLLQPLILLQISGSSGTNLSTYGKSQIELAYNGRMYAACNPSGNMYNMGSFDPQNSIPQILGNNFSFLLYPMFLAVHGVLPLHLPDQIDGQDYSATTPSVSAQVSNHAYIELS